jgi:hypothetical protein
MWTSDLCSWSGQPICSTQPRKTIYSNVLLVVRKQLEHYVFEKGVRIYLRSIYGVNLIKRSYKEDMRVSYYRWRNGSFPLIAKTALSDLASPRKLAGQFRHFIISRDYNVRFCKMAAALNRRHLLLLYYVGEDEK